MDKINFIGMPDLPLDGKDDDLLQVEKYIKGLSKFVLGCSTPMSIALQGDWGTGKTSFINKMQSILDKDPSIKTVYFNTWQYSQFSLSADLYKSFVLCIIDALKGKDDINDKVKKVFTSLFTVAQDIGRQTIENITKYDIGVVEDLLKKETEKVNYVADLKKNFQEMIDDLTKNGGRVVIFIDDLDRLNPEIAVALLEVIKLFLDVPKCVFVLAVDYDVVVKGVRKKYGADMDDEKCRSFFDKIIQLPFRMPVEKYVIEDFLKEKLGAGIEGYETALAKLIKETLGPNPRTIKRLINAYSLLAIVSGIDNINSLKTTLLLTSLIMQMSDLDLYMDMMKNIDSTDSLKQYLKDEFDKEENAYADMLEYIKNKAGNYENDFWDVLNISAITTVYENRTETKEIKRVTHINVFGNMLTVKNPTEAYVSSVKAVINNYSGGDSEKVKQLIGDFDRLFTLDGNNKKGSFVIKKSIELDGYKPVVYVGTNLSTAIKVKQLRNICGATQTNLNNVHWYDGDALVL